MKRVILTVLAFVSCLIANAQSIQDARKLTENEQFEAASGIYQSLITTNPSDVVNYYYYGENLLLSENPDSASIIFEKGIALDANNALLKIGRAKILLSAISLKEARSANEKDPNPENAKRFQDAQANLAKAQTLIDEAVLNSKDAVVLDEAAEALIHYKTKDLDKAKTLLDKSMLIDGKNIETHLLFGELYTELNNGTLAADYYNRALDLNRSSARAIVGKGRLYKRSTNYEGAAREFENAISIDPNYAPAHRELAEVYIKLNKLDKALEEYKKYLGLSNACGARIRYSYFLFIAKKYQDAVNELNQIGQRCDSNNNSLLRVKMYSYYELPDYEKALQAANKLFTQVPPEKRTSTDLEYYGKALIKTSQDSIGIMNGIDQLQKALAMDPNRIDLFSPLADGYIKLKQYANAIQILNQKLTIGKGFTVSDYYSLAQSYYYNKQFQMADSVSKIVNEKSPTYPQGWMFRARSNSAIDSTAEDGLAKPHYEKYIELTVIDSVKYRSGLAEAYGYLAYYYLIKKDTANSIMYLEKKLPLLPADSDEKKTVKDAIDQLKGKGPKTPPKK